MRAMFGLLLVLWSLAGGAWGLYTDHMFRNVYAMAGTATDVVERLPSLKYGLDLLAIELQLWLGGVIMLAALTIAAPSRRNY